MTKKNLILLKFGVLQTVLMAVYHFYLPFQYNWSGYLKEAGKTMDWSLHSLNNYFSFNLLILALFLRYYLHKKSSKEEIIRVLSSIVFLFWGFSIVYLIIKPIPLPDNLSWLGIILLGVALLNGILFLIPLVSLYRKNKS